MDSDQEPTDDQTRVKESVKDFAAKYRSKGECYRFLAVDLGVFLPPYNNVTVWHLKDLIMNVKTVGHFDTFQACFVFACMTC